MRDLTGEEKEVLQEHHEEIQQLARVHSEETEKTFREIINDIDKVAEEEDFDPEEFALQKIKELGFPVEYDDQDLIEQRFLFTCQVFDV